MWYNLTERRPALEEMDRPDIDPAALQRALRALERINHIGLGLNLFWPTLARELPSWPAARPMRLLDIGCGAGDLARRIELRARYAGWAVRADGCDINPVAIEMAQRNGAAAGCTGRYHVCDAVRDPLPGEYDVIISSLFLHHLENEEAVTVLRRCAASTRSLLLFSDLIRSRAGLFLVYLATRTLTRSPVVHTDGVTSLRAAFTIDEARELAGAAGLGQVELVRRWPERFLMTWRP
jgi:2-polyprenyl-3-methyl-5-hydroxy-6-metoxy-1,4-benzoquinol methylase